MRRVSSRPEPWFVVLCILFTIVWADARAQGEAQRQPSEQSVSQADLERKRQLIQDGLKGQLGRDVSDRVRDPAAPLDPPELALNDAPTKAAYLASMREYYRYRESGFQHRRDVFAWQHWSSKVIFGVVLALVAAGIYFAAVQFHRGLQLTGQPRHPAGSEVTEFVASFKGIKVSSPVLGVIILVISLVFFYLYLAFVYPIHEVM